MSLMMTVSQMTREGHHGQVGGRAPATLAVNRGLFLGAPRPVEGHRRQWPSWPSIISYPAPLTNISVQASRHASRFVVQGLPLMKPCWWSENSFSESIKFMIWSLMNDSMTLQATAVRLTGLWFPGSCLFPFL